MKFIACTHTDLLVSAVAVTNIFIFKGNFKINCIVEAHYMVSYGMGFGTGVGLNGP